MPISENDYNDAQGHADYQAYLASDPPIVEVTISKQTLVTDETLIAEARKGLTRAESERFDDAQCEAKLGYVRNDSSARDTVRKLTQTLKDSAARQKASEDANAAAEAERAAEEAAREPEPKPEPVAEEARS